MVEIHSSLISGVSNGGSTMTNYKIIIGIIAITAILSFSLIAYGCNVFPPDNTTIEQQAAERCSDLMNTGSYSQCYSRAMTRMSTQVGMCSDYFGWLQI